MAQIEIRTGSYNERRYGKPYIAEMNFSQNPQGECRWGTWIGDHSCGSEGILLLEAELGSIVITGQKDFRARPGKSAPKYFQVSNEGKLIPLPGKAEAFRAFRTAHAAAASSPTT